MKAITFQAVGSVAFEEVADPRIEHELDVIVEVRAAGLCGSDHASPRQDELRSLRL